MLDSGVALGGIPYLAMELLIGRTLADELKERRVLSLQRTIQIILPVCDVLIEAHAATLVHRDIKPENVFVARRAQGTMVKVLDFGLAKIIDGMDIGPDAQLTTDADGRFTRFHDLNPRALGPDGEPLPEESGISIVRRTSTSGPPWPSITIASLCMRAP